MFLFAFYIGIKDCSWNLKFNKLINVHSFIIHVEVVGNVDIKNIAIFKVSRF